MKFLSLKGFVVSQCILPSRWNITLEYDVLSPNHESIAKRYSVSLRTLLKSFSVTQKVNWIEKELRVPPQYGFACLAKVIIYALYE